MYKLRRGYRVDLIVNFLFSFKYFSIAQRKWRIRSVWQFKSNKFRSEKRRRFYGSLLKVVVNNEFVPIVVHHVVL